MKQSHWSKAVKILQGDNPVRFNSAAWLNKVVDGRRTWKQRSRAITFCCPFCTILQTSHPKLQPLRHSRLNNHPVGQKNDEKHSVDWSFDRVRKTEKPMRYWPCQKLLSFKRADLHVVKTGHPLCRHFRRLLFAYDPWRAPFSDVASVTSVSKQAQPDAETITTGGWLELQKTLDFMWKNPFARCAAK
jgi:hypothetical protein